MGRTGVQAAAVDTSATYDDLGVSVITSLGDTGQFCSVSIENHFLRKCGSGVSAEKRCGLNHGQRKPKCRRCMPEPGIVRRQFQRDAAPLQENHG
jgi:hypothetical protein